MRWLDWIVLVAFLAWVVWDGARKGRKAKNVEGYFLAGRRMPWWAMGISVMATQASAITLLSTTGHGYYDGLHFLHVYLALPFAMVILCATVVPWFTRSRVFTAYEYLERRFDGPTRSVAAFLYLVSRGLAVGPVLFAPSVVLAIMFGLDQWQAILLMGLLCTGYTVMGGMAAVISTDVKQMTVMMLGIITCLFIAISTLPDDVGFGGAMELAGASRKLEAFVVETDVKGILATKYNVVSALLGGIFLFLGYFGADQSQVQRYLTGKSTKESGRSLLLSAFAKVPMQFVILLLGALLFVHYTFERPPVMFQTQEFEAVVAAKPEAEAEVWRERYADLEGRFDRTAEQREAMAREFLGARRGGADGSAEAENLRLLNGQLKQLNDEGVALLEEAVGGRRSDTNYIFPHFLIEALPIGLLGLVIAAVFAAAMSSVDSALSSLATSSVMDFYVRLRRKPASDRHLLRVSRGATLFWGVFAVGAAFFVGNLGPMIEVVNKIGSYFYGTLFGVFVLGWLVRSARGWMGWLSMVGGMSAVAFTDLVINRDEKVVEFLWYNLIGFLGVMIVGLILARLAGRRPAVRSS